MKDCFQANLTPTEAKLYKIAKIILKKRYVDAQMSKLKKRLKRNEHAKNSDFIKNYKGLSETQKVLIEMQLRTAQQPCHMSLNLSNSYNYTQL